MTTPPKTPRHANSDNRQRFKQRYLLLSKGGISDYRVKVGVIYVRSLSQFRNSYCSSAEPFSPVPESIEFDFGREILPAREDE